MAPEVAKPMPTWKWTAGSRQILAITIARCRSVSLRQPLLCAGLAACAICRRAESTLRGSAEILLFLFGAVLLLHGVDQLVLSQGPDFGTPTTYSEANFEDELIRNAVGNLFKLIEGAFGALIMVVAGLGAIVASTMGAYRLAVSLIVVSVSAFILRSLVSLFFGSDYIDYEAGSFN